LARLEGRESFAYHSYALEWGLPAGTLEEQTLKATSSTTTTIIEYYRGACAGQKSKKRLSLRVAAGGGAGGGQWRRSGVHCDCAIVSGSGGLGPAHWRAWGWPWGPWVAPKLGGALGHAGPQCPRARWGMRKRKYREKHKFTLSYSAGVEGTQARRLCHCQCAARAAHFYT